MFSPRHTVMRGAVRANRLGVSSAFHSGPPGRFFYRN